MKCLLYRMEYNDFTEFDLHLPNEYSYTIWKPSLFRIKPKGLPLFPFFIWWLFHCLRIFSNREYSVFLIYRGSKISHYSGIFPGLFRFPFMGRNDLTIGGSWTNVEDRGKGLYGFMLYKSVEIMRSQGRKFWTIIEEENIPVVKGHTKLKYKLYGYVIRTRRLGLKILGDYRIDSILDP